MALSAEQVKERLARLSGWQGGTGGIERTFVLPDFPTAITLVNRIGALAEELNHHPDIDIRYDRVRVFVVSHDEGAVTERDFRLAARVQEAARDLGG